MNHEHYHHLAFNIIAERAFSLESSNNSSYRVEVQTATMTPQPTTPDVAQPRPSAGDDVKKRVSRKLQKKKRQESPLTVELPERLQSSDESDSDDTVPTQGPPMFMNMNQSIFGLIAAAGSRVDFNDRFDGSSSDEEDGHGGKERDERGAGDLAKTSVLKGTRKDKDKDKHRRRLSGHKLLQSLPMLPKLRSKSKRQSSRLSATQEEATSSEASGAATPPPALTLTRHDSRLAPVMSRMLEARAEVSSRPSFDMDRASSDFSQSSDGVLPPLSKRLKEIFEFDEPEQVIEGWFLPSMVNPTQHANSC